MSLLHRTPSRRFPSTARASGNNPQTSAVRIFSINPVRGWGGTPHAYPLPFSAVAGLGLCTSKKWSSSSPDAAPRPFSVASKPIVEGYGYLFGICSRCTRIMTFASLQNESSWNFFKMFSIVYYCFVIVRWGRWAFRKLRCIFHQC